MDAIALLKTLCNQALIDAELMGRDLTVREAQVNQRAVGEVEYEVEGSKKTYRVEIFEVNQAS